jgi:hypothetical protein
VHQAERALVIVRQNTDKTSAKIAGAERSGKDDQQHGEKQAAGQPGFAGHDKNFVGRSRSTSGKDAPSAYDGKCVAEIRQNR